VDGPGRVRDLDSGTIDRLLSGSMGPADAPPGYALVAGMIAAARPRAAQVWIPGEAQALQAFRASKAGSPMMLPEERRAAHKPQRSKLVMRIPAKVAVAGALVLVGGTAAAAATGSLPGPIQSTVSSVLSHVGISVPSPVNPHPSANASPHAFAGADNSFHGLCTAYSSHGSSSQTSVPARLSAAAQAANESVSQFCNSVPSPSSVNPASSPSAHKSDEAGTVQQQSTGSGGTAGPGGAATHSGTPGPPADQNQSQGPGAGAGLGQAQSPGRGEGKGKGSQTAVATTTTVPPTTTTTVPPTTTTTTKSNGGGHSSNTTANGHAKN
jgi:hypothetical protein